MAALLYAHRRHLPAAAAPPNKRRTRCLAAAADGRDFRIRMRRAEQPLELSHNIDGVGVLGARLDRDRDGLLVFFVCIILSALPPRCIFLHLLVAAAPVVMLASQLQ